MRRTAIYIPNPDLRTIDDNADNEYDQVAPDEIRSISSESDLAESPAGHTIRSSYKSPIFDTPLEPCPVNGCPLNPQSGVKLNFWRENSKNVFMKKYSGKKKCSL